MAEEVQSTGQLQAQEPEITGTRDLPQAFVDAQYKKGQSGNPAGRKIGSKNRDTVLREMLELVARDGKDADILHPLTGEPLTLYDKGCLHVALKFANGDTNLLDRVHDTLFGKQSQLIGSDPDNPPPPSTLPTAITITMVAPEPKAPNEPEHPTSGGG